MEMLQITPKPPIGLAFEIADLLLLQGWATVNDIRMVVELDHWVEGEEYEEVVAFYGTDSALRRWILWRAATQIVAQPLIGRTCRFDSVADALGSLPGNRSEFQVHSAHGSKAVRSPRRSKGQSATPRRAKRSGERGDGSTSAANASPSVR
jgi:hypothetical protein